MDIKDHLIVLLELTAHKLDLFWFHFGFFGFSCNQLMHELFLSRIFDNHVIALYLYRWALESYLKSDVGKAFLLYSKMAELGYEVAHSNAIWVLAWSQNMCSNGTYSI